MNKKIARAAVIAVCAACAATSALSFTACGENYDPSTYYNKTISFTGKAYCRGFEDKGAYDNYHGDLGENTTHKEILETYWDNIDWSNWDNPPANTDAVKAELEKMKPEDYVKDISFTVTKTDTVTLTLNMPEDVAGKWGTSVTMPLIEDPNNIPPDMGYLSLTPGYIGAAAKVDGDERLAVTIWMVKNRVEINGKSQVMDTVNMTILSQRKNELGGYYQTTNTIIDTNHWQAIFNEKPIVNGDETHWSSVLRIDFCPEIIITDAQ